MADDLLEPLIRQAAMLRMERERNPVPPSNYEEWVRSSAAAFDPNVDPPIVNPNLSVLKKTGYGVNPVEEKKRIERMQQQYRRALAIVNDWYNNAPMEENYANEAEFNAALDAYNKTSGTIKKASSEKARLENELTELGVSPESPIAKFSAGLSQGVGMLEPQQAGIAKQRAGFAREILGQLPALQFPDQ